LSESLPCAHGWSANGRSGGVVMQGTKVKNIRLIDGDHDIDCKIDGFGSMGLKTEFVRKI
jgi:protein PhnA